MEYTYEQLKGIIKVGDKVRAVEGRGGTWKFNLKDEQVRIKE